MRVRGIAFLRMRGAGVYGLCGGAGQDTRCGYGGDRTRKHADARYTGYLADGYACGNACADADGYACGNADGNAGANAAGGSDSHACTGRYADTRAYSYARTDGGAA